MFRQRIAAHLGNSCYPIEGAFLKINGVYCTCTYIDTCTCVHEHGNVRGFFLHVLNGNS